MRGGAAGEQLDQGGAAIGARPKGGPPRRGVDREKIVAVDAQAGEAEADRPRREGRRLAAGDLLMRGDRPLVVDDVEHDRRAVDRGEGQGMVKIGLGRRPFADPGDGDAVVALVGRGHRPADRLRKLVAEIAGDREDRGLAGRIEHRHLVPLQPVLARSSTPGTSCRRAASRGRSGCPAAGRSETPCRRGPRRRPGRRRSPPRRCTSCRRRSCPGAATRYMRSS